MTEIIVATRSAHKLREIREILAEYPHLQIIDLDEAGVERSPEEDDLEPHDSFRDNALAKARHFARLTGKTVLADDSGLSVDALGGAPGVRSKRFSGRTDLSGNDLDQANNEKLLEVMKKVPTGERGAHYVCAVAVVSPDGDENTFTGTCHGRILRARKGSGGFGYDPLFHLDSHGTSFGDLDPVNTGRSGRLSHLERHCPGGGLFHLCPELFKL